MTTTRYIVINTGKSIWYVKDTMTATLWPFSTKKAATAKAAEKNAR